MARVESHAELLPQIEMSVAANAPGITFAINEKKKKWCLCSIATPFVSSHMVSAIGPTICMLNDGTSNQNEANITIQIDNTSAYRQKSASLYALFRRTGMHVKVTNTQFHHSNTIVPTIAAQQKA